MKPIYYLSYNGFYEDYRKLFHAMDLQNEYLASSDNSNLRLCVLFQNTSVTGEVLDKFIRSIIQIPYPVKQMAIVGLSLNVQALFLLKIKLNNIKLPPYQFFSSNKDALHYLEETA